MAVGVDGGGGRSSGRGCFEGGEAFLEEGGGRFEEMELLEDTEFSGWKFWVERGRSTPVKDCPEGASVLGF